MDLVNRTRDFLKERCDFLLKDVCHCVLHDNSTPNWPAPVPALLYCFSTIDLLGSLHTGKFNVGRDSENARLYMRNLMEYTDLQIELLQQIYRHKLVHTSMPRSVYTKGGLNYYWEWVHNNRSNHLQISHKGGAAPQARWFTVSILSLAEDIQDSVFGRGKYLDQLPSNKDLQRSCQRTLDQI